MPGATGKWQLRKRHRQPEVAGLLSQHCSSSGGTCRIPALLGPRGPLPRVGPAGGGNNVIRPAGAGPFPISQVNTGRLRRLPLLTLLHPGEVSSSLASPHGNSRSSSENRLSRRQRRQQLLQSSPGRRLYSASLASPRPGCSRRTRRHLGRATSASPRDVRSHWRAQGQPASRDRRHSAGARGSGGGWPETQSAPAARAPGQGAEADLGPLGGQRDPSAGPARESVRASAPAADPPPHAGVGRPWGAARPAEAEASTDGVADLARLGDKAADVQ